MSNTITPTSFTSPVSQTTQVTAKEQSELDSLRKEIAGLQAQLGDTFTKTVDSIPNSDAIKSAFSKAGETVKSGVEKYNEVAGKNPALATVVAGVAGLALGVAIEKSGVVGKAQEGIGNAADNMKKTIDNGIKEAKALPGKNPLATSIAVEAAKIGISALITNEIVKHQIKEAMANK